jgi:anti-sigma B factor antagonist
MRLSLKTRITDHVVIIRCEGRITSGDELRKLHGELEDAVLARKRVVLHLGDVSFIDSAGLGLVVRLFSRLRNDGGGLRLCELSPIVLKALQVTNLHAVIPIHETEQQAVSAFELWQQVPNKSHQEPLATVVCVDESFNLLAYLNALLTEAGYEVFPTRHLNDAKTFISAIRPQVAVFGPEGQTNAHLIDVLRHTHRDLRILLLPPDFSTEDATTSGAELVARVQSLLSARQAKSGAD